MARTKRSVIIAAAAAAAKKKQTGSKQNSVSQEHDIKMKESRSEASCPDDGHDVFVEQFPAFRQLRRKPKIPSSVIDDCNKRVEIKDESINTDRSFKRQYSGTLQSSSGCSSLSDNNCNSCHIKQPFYSPLTCQITGKKKGNLNTNTSKICSPKPAPDRICSRERRSCVKHTAKTEDSGSLLQQMLIDQDIPQHSETSGKKGCRKSTKKSQGQESQVTSVKSRCFSRYRVTEQVFLKENKTSENSDSLSFLPQNQTGPIDFEQPSCSRTSPKQFGTPNPSRRSCSRASSPRHFSRSPRLSLHNSDSEDCKIYVYQNVKQAIKILPKTTVMPIVCMEDILKDEGSSKEEVETEIETAVTKNIPPVRVSPRTKKCLVQKSDCQNEHSSSIESPLLIEKTKLHASECLEKSKQAKIKSRRYRGDLSLSSSDPISEKKSTKKSQKRTPEKQRQSSSSSVALNSECCRTPTHPLVKMDSENGSSGLKSVDGRNKLHRIRSPNSRYSDDMILIPLVSPRRNGSVRKSKHSSPENASDSGDSTICKLSPGSFNVPAQFDTISPFSSERSSCSGQQSMSISSSTVRQLDFSEENCHPGTIPDKKCTKKPDESLLSLIDRINRTLIDNKSQKLNGLLGSVDQSLLINYDSDEAVSSVCSVEMLNEKKDQSLNSTSMCEGDDQWEDSKSCNISNHDILPENNRDSTANIDIIDGMSNEKEPNYPEIENKEDFNTTRNIFDVFCESENKSDEENNSVDSASRKDEEDSDNVIVILPKIEHLDDPAQQNVQKDEIATVGTTFERQNNDDGKSEQEKISKPGVVISDQSGQNNDHEMKSDLGMSSELAIILSDQSGQKNDHNSKSELEMSSELAIIVSDQSGQKNDHNSKSELELSSKLVTVDADNSNPLAKQHVLKRSRRQRMCESKPITVLKAVEITDSEPLAAFVSAKLDDLLKKEKSGLCSSQDNILKSRELTLREEFEPDFDEIDGLLFMSFPSEDALKAHIEVEKKTCLNPNIFLGMCRIKKLKEKQRRLQSQLHKRYSRISLLKTKQQMHHNLRGMHKKLERYQKLYRDEIDLILQCTPSVLSKVPQKTKDVTKLKGWRSNHCIEELTLSNNPVETGGKLHWRTEEKIMRNFTSEDIKKMGIQFKKKRRKNLIYTKRKGMSKGDPNKIEGRRKTLKDDEVPIYDGMDFSRNSLVDSVCSVKDDDATDVKDMTKRGGASARRRLRVKALNNLNLSDDDQLILKKLGGFGELKVIRRKRVNLNLIHLTKSMAIAAASALQDIDLQKTDSIRICDMDMDMMSSYSHRAYSPPATTPRDQMNCDSESTHYLCPNVKASNSEPGPFEDAKMEFSGCVSEQCDKPGCRYGCICHLCRLTEGLEEDTQKPTSSQCEKEYCMLGCICDSIAFDKSVQDKNHCGKAGCMLKCICHKKRQMLDNALSPPPVLPVSHELTQDASFNSDELPALISNEDEHPRDESCSAIKKKRKSSPKFQPTLPVREKTYRLAKNLDAISRKAMMVYETSEMYTEQRRKTSTKKKKDIPSSSVSDGFTTISREYKPVNQIESKNSTRDSKMKTQPITIVLSDEDEISDADYDFVSDTGDCARTRLYKLPQRQHTVSETSKVEPPKTNDLLQGVDHGNTQTIHASQVLKRPRSTKEPTPSEPARKTAMLDTPFTGSSWKTQMVCLKTKKKSPVLMEKDLDTPHLNLLEIVSNCDWENSKTQILSKISQLISRELYPSSQKLAVKEFVVEILPKAEKPAVIPPELQKALPSGMFSIRVKVVKAETISAVVENCEQNSTPVTASSLNNTSLQLEEIVAKCDKEETDTSVTLSTKLDQIQGTLLTVISTQHSSSFPETVNGHLSRIVPSSSDVTYVTKDNPVVSSDAFGPTGISGLSRLQINRPVGRCTMESVKKNTLGNVCLDNTNGIKWSVENDTSALSNITFNMTKKNLNGSTLRLKPGVDLNNTPQGLVISGPMAKKNRGPDDVALKDGSSRKLKRLLGDVDTGNFKSSESINSHTSTLSIAGDTACTTTSTTLAINGTCSAQRVCLTQDQQFAHRSSPIPIEMSETILKLSNSTVTKVPGAENGVLLNPSNSGADSLCLSVKSVKEGSQANHESSAISCQSISPSPYPGVNTISGQAVRNSESVPVPVTLIGPFSKPVCLLSTQEGAGGGSSSVIHFVPVESNSSLNGAPVHVSQPNAVGGNTSPNYIAVPVTLKPKKITKNRDSSEVNCDNKKQECDTIATCSLQPSLANGSFQTLIYADPVTKQFIPMTSTGESSPNNNSDIVTTKEPQWMTNSEDTSESKTQNTSKVCTDDYDIQEQKNQQTHESDIQTYEKHSGVSSCNSAENINDLGDDKLLNGQCNADLAFHNIFATNEKDDASLKSNDTLKCEPVEPVSFLSHNHNKKLDIETIIFEAVNESRQNENCSPYTDDQNCELDKVSSSTSLLSSTCENRERVNEGTFVSTNPARRKSTDHIHNSSSNSADSDTTMIYIDSDSELDSHELGENSNRKVIVIRGNNISKTGRYEQGTKSNSRSNSTNSRILDATVTDCNDLINKNEDFPDKFSDTHFNLSKNTQELIQNNSTSTKTNKSYASPSGRNNSDNGSSKQANTAQEYVKNEHGSMSGKIELVDNVKGSGSLIMNKTAGETDEVTHVNFARSVEILNKELGAQGSVIGSRKRKTALIPRPDFEEPKKMHKAKTNSHFGSKVDQTCSFSTGEIHNIQNEKIVDVLEISEGESDVDIETVGTPGCSAAKELSQPSLEHPNISNMLKNKRKPHLIPIINPAVDDDIEFTEEVLLVEDKKVSRTKKEKVAHSNREKARRVEQRRTFSFLRQVVFGTDDKNSNSMFSQPEIPKVQLLTKAVQTIAELEESSSKLSASLEKEMAQCNKNQLKFFTLAENIMKDGILNQQIERVLEKIEIIPFVPEPNPQIRRFSYHKDIQLPDSHKASLKGSTHKNVLKIERKKKPQKPQKRSFQSVFHVTKPKSQKYKPSKPEIYIDYAEEDFDQESRHGEKAGFVLASGFVDDMQPHNEPDVPVSSLTTYKPHEKGTTSFGKVEAGSPLHHISENLTLPQECTDIVIESVESRVEFSEHDPDIIEIEPIHNISAHSQQIIRQGKNLTNINQSNTIPSEILVSDTTLMVNNVNKTNKTLMIPREKTGNSLLQDSCIILTPNDLQTCFTHERNEKSLLDTDAVSVSSGESSDNERSLMEGVDDAPFTIEEIE